MCGEEIHKTLAESLHLIPWHVREISYSSCYNLLLVKPLVILTVFYSFLLLRESRTFFFFFYRFIWSKKWYKNESKAGIYRMKIRTWNSLGVYHQSVRCTWPWRRVSSIWLLVRLYCGTSISSQTSVTLLELPHCPVVWLTLWCERRWLRWWVCGR